jgi:hypothetical protein
MACCFRSGGLIGDDQRSDRPHADRLRETGSGQKTVLAHG